MAAVRPALYVCRRWSVLSDRPDPLPSDRDAAFSRRPGSATSCLSHAVIDGSISGAIRDPRCIHTDHRADSAGVGSANCQLQHVTVRATCHLRHVAVRGCGRLSSQTWDCPGGLSSQTCGCPGGLSSQACGCPGLRAAVISDMGLSWRPVISDMGLSGRPAISDT